MLWTCPFISPDSSNFRKLENEGLLLTNQNNETEVRRWWSGYSAILDLTNDKAIKWYLAQNKTLIDEYNIDGFKLDAGDPDFYDNKDNSYLKGSRNN